MKKIILFVLCAFSLSASFAQQKKAPVIKKYDQKIKPPKLSTVWGGMKDSVGIPAEAAVALLDQKLVITDGKMPYEISSYKVYYKQRTVTETEDGKVSPTFAIYNETFLTYPFSAMWKQSLTDKLKTGDELMLYDVIAKDKQGRVMYAPNVKISVL